LLGIPVHKGRVEEDKITCSRSSCQFVPSVVSVNVQTKINVLTMWSWRILWDGFLHVAIEWFPILFFEMSHVNVRVGRIEHHSTVVFDLGVSKDIVYSFHVSFSGESQV
jgi:hypothetical protein